MEFHSTGASNFSILVETGKDACRLGRDFSMGAYYRTTSSMGFGGFTMTPAVKFLLIVNALLFVIPALLGINPNRLWLLLVPGLAVRGMIWQPFTYMFFHGGLSHFLFNMLFLWMFGTTVEQTWGTRRFLRYYLACGVAAGMAVVLAGLVEGTRQSLYTATVGSSGAIYGLILAFGLLFPDAPVWFMFFFRMPAKYFVILLACIEFFLQSTQPGTTISHIAHLGGMAYGVVYIQYFLRGRALSHSHRRRSRSSRLDLKGTYQRWRLRRARRKFEVYMRQVEREEPPDKDRWVN